MEHAPPPPAPGTGPDDPNSVSDQMLRLNRTLHTVVAALRRRGLWLVFGALGGLLGGTVVAVTVKPQVDVHRYYKATVEMRLTQSATTSQPVDEVQWSLQIAQIAIASNQFKKLVAAQSGVSSDYVKNHLMSIAYKSTATVEMTAVSTDADQAVTLAYHGGASLNEAIRTNIAARELSNARDIRSEVAPLEKQTRTLQSRLSGSDLTDQQRTALKSRVSTLLTRIDALGQSSPGITQHIPQFSMTREPTAIRINSRAFYRRWLLGSQDIGTPQIRDSASLVSVGSTDSATQASTAKQLLSDTEIPKPKVRPPLESVSLGLLAGLLLGLSGVVLGEAWDERVRDADHAERSTGFPIIAEIPRLSRRGRKAMLTTKEPPSRAAAHRATVRYRGAARLIAAELWGDDELPVARDQRRAPILLVTSAAPGEGKTTSTAALAAAFANLGLEVLVVDGDYHRRTLRKHVLPIPNFVDPESPTATRLEHVWHLDDSPSFADAKASSTIVSRLVQHVDRLRSDFDIIVMDSPPVLSTTDAVELLPYADAAVLIVRAETTSARSAEHAGNTIRNHSVVVPGTIVTDVTAGSTGPGS